MKDIGSFEAKTHLPRLLREVCDGKSFKITNKGKPVAMLMPIQPEKANADVVIDKIRSLRKGITLGEYSLHELIQNGRR